MLKFRKEDNYMKYLDQIEKALKIISYESTTKELSDNELESLKEEISKMDDYYVQLEEIYTTAGKEYLYLIGDDIENNSYIAYQLGEYYENLRVEHDKLGTQKVAAEYALDCLVYAYKNEIEDAFHPLMTCLLFYCDIKTRFITKMKDNEFLKLIEILEPIIEEENNSTYKLLLNKRIGDFHYREVSILYDICDKHNFKFSLDLFKSCIKSVKGYHFDVIEKIKKLFEWPSLKDAPLKKELHYSLYDTTKMEYRFINDEVCDKAFKYFNLENYHECDLAFDELLYLNNKNVFYNYALFLKHGYYEENKEEALKYFIKAYELGVLEASYHIADITNDIEYANIAIENNILAGYKILLRNTDYSVSIRDEYYKKIVEVYDN